MNLITFEDQLDRHGGDLALWPADIRAVAAAFLEVTPGARDMLRVMRDVEVILREKPTSAATGLETIAAQAMRRRQVALPHGVAWAAGWSAAAGIVWFVGCILGGIAPQPHDDNPEVVLSASLDVTGAIDVD